MSQADAFSRYQRSMYHFSRDVVGVALYPYQVAWADHVLAVVAEKRNEIVTVEMPRQSGKNETSAQLEVALLARHGQSGGDIVKCAPTWKPQIVNSKLRFDNRSQAVNRRLPFLGIRASMGYMFRCGRASIQFLSAEPTASVVGATASLLLEVDEAQDVAPAKFDKDFSPMRASTGAPLVAYGTTWTDDTLLERFKRDVLEGRAAGRVFRVTPDHVADANPAYGRFVDAEVSRLGREHPFVKTQYFLEPLATAGRMLNRQQLELMAGQGQRHIQRERNPVVVAGLDFAGGDEIAGLPVSLATASQRDSVALTIGQVDWIKIAEGLIVPHLRMLARYEWVDVNPVTLHTALYEILWNRWRADRVHCDATGIGAASTAFLAGAINKPDRERVIPVTFDGAWQTHTRLAFQYLALINGGRLVDYQVAFDPIAEAGKPAADPADFDRRAWWQRGHAKLDGKPNQRVRAYVPDAEGHDDLLASEMLMVDAAYAVSPPRTMSAATVNFYG